MRKEEPKVSANEKNESQLSQENIQPNGAALIPLLVFLLLYLGVGVVLTIMDVEDAFYQFPAPVAALIGIIVAVLMAKGDINDRISAVISGAGNHTIITMCLIFLLAGAFATVAEEMGAVDSTVNLSLAIVPPQLLLPGFFIVTAFISLAMGTSMGTIGAVAPIAAGLAEQIDIHLGLAMAVIIGGAMFGDNLSIISDTTIAATQSQGVRMKDKFIMNLRIVLPAAIITMIILFFIGDVGVVEAEAFEIIKVIPYVLVLVMALMGINVFIVLFLGLLLVGIIGIAYGEFSLLELTQYTYDGFLDMGEVFFLSMFVGGLAALIRREGGLAYLVELITRRVRTERGAEFGIGALASVADICMANNTVAIVITGPLARNIAQENRVDLRRSASLIDIFPAVFQGIIPYGAQILLAGSIAGVSPFAIIPWLHYQFLMFICAVVAIYLGIPKIKEEEKVLQGEEMA